MTYTSDLTVDMLTFQEVPFSDVPLSFQRQNRTSYIAASHRSLIPCDGSVTFFSRFSDGFPPQTTGGSGGLKGAALLVLLSRNHNVT